MHFACYLSGGMKAKEVADLPFDRLPQITVQQLRQRRISDPGLAVIVYVRRATARAGTSLVQKLFHRGHARHHHWLGQRGELGDLMR